MSNCHVSYWKMCAMHWTLCIATILRRGLCLVSLVKTARGGNKRAKHQIFDENQIKPYSKSGPNRLIRGTSPAEDALMGLGIKIPLASSPHRSRSIQGSRMLDKDTSVLLQLWSRGLWTASASVRAGERGWHARSN
jgi:hypothetical protein